MRMRRPGTRDERAVKAVLAALAEGRMASRDGADMLTVERVLDGIGKAMLAGILVLLLFAVGQKAVLATLTLGLFAALASAAAGAALGFLFALPSSAGRVLVAPGADPLPAAPPASAGAEPAGNGGSAPPASVRAFDDWFRDNPALERLSDWLVGAILALSLANFEAWRLRLQQLAIDITQGMGIDGGQWGAPAGVILAAYALLGFLGGYLWTRRYMLLELARARREGRREQYQDQLDAAEVARRLASPASVQNVAPASLAPEAAVAQARAASEEAAHRTGSEPALESQPARPADPWAVAIEPGDVPGDPWAGRFGGHAAGGGFELAATVRAVAGNPDLFGVDLTIVGQRGQRARLYLHPTFPDPIRELLLDAQGRATQRLLAWGAFTVGVQFDTGQLRELDLAMLPGAPARFRAR